MMIEVKNLCKSFTRQVQDEKSKKKKFKIKKEEFLAVNNLSFTVGKGEIIGILGPNGAGKTTLLRMLGGILTPTSGHIQIDQFDYEKDKNAAKKEIGYLSGNTKLYDRLSPRELLFTFGSLYERTSIARCLVHNPSIYIFDEPTLGLDVISSKSIIDFMKNERDKGKTVLYSTHYMEEAEILCDKIYMMHKGEFIAYGSCEELKNNYNTNSLRDIFIKLASERGDLIEE